MADFMLLMHNDVPSGSPERDWTSYLASLRESKRFSGGSEIGGGACYRKSGDAAPLSASLGGYFKVTAASLDDAARLLVGNPVYEAGGTVEIRELPDS